MLVDNKIPTVVKGARAIDDRGTISFVNQFDFDGVKRSYIVRNHNSGFIRAFHGHHNEGKFVQVVQGTALFKIFKIGEYEKWDDGKEIRLFNRSFITKVLSEDDPSVFWIPPGFYNGFKTLTDDAIIQFFSTSTLEESSSDDVRLPWDRFGKEIWEEKHR